MLPPRGLGAALRDTNAYVRHEALRTLAPGKHFTGTTWKVSDAYFPYIERLVADPNSFVRLAAVQAAVRCGVQLSLVALERLLVDPDRAVSHAAAVLCAPKNRPK